MEKIISLCKRRGFIFPGSEIYGGLQNSWDYGPLGTELKNNIKQEWWKRFVHQRTDMVGIDAALIMNPKVWEASGHLQNFKDALIECKNCHQRFRIDELAMDGGRYVCTNCNGREFTEAKGFNLMLKTFLGPSEDVTNVVYLRPETAQAMFVQFKNVLNTTRKQIPFGIAQIGKAFRNEITPGNFIFRTREFEQMEIEYFVKEEEWEKWFEHWKEEMVKWVEDLGVKKENYKLIEIPEEERAHYSKRTIDIEYKYPFGQKELYGLAYRGSYDLENHMRASQLDLSYHNPNPHFVDFKCGQCGSTQTDKLPLPGEVIKKIPSLCKNCGSVMTYQGKFLPHVIEPTWGVDRSVLVAMLEAYTEEDVPSVASAKEGAPVSSSVKALEDKTDTRVVLKFPYWLAPIKVAVLPLSKKEELQNVARPIYEDLIKHFVCEYDETQSIGKRYRRQDEIGTPFCVTVDFETLTDNAVTVRERDSMKQDRIKISELKSYLKGKLAR